MPFTSTGSLVSEQSRSRSRQLIDGSMRANISGGVPPAGWPTAAAKAGTVMSAGTSNPVRRSRSRRPSRGASTVSAIAQEARLVGLVDQRPCDAGIAEHVELEPARGARGGRGDLGRRRGRERREHHRRPGGGGRAGHAGLAVRVGDALKRHRRDQQRHRQAGAQDGGLRGRGAHVHERARPQQPAGERLDVVAQRALVTCAPREVAVGPGVQPLAGEPLVVRDVAGLRGDLGDHLIRLWLRSV